MIFETEATKEVEVVGDIKNNNVSIDTSNIDFIVTILSTNLYSKPIESFIRETVSNAWDSHVEAGVDDPVILELGKDTEGTMFCRIQDFGVGLSPARFNDVYRNIGSSTKRGDNDQIGGFGIGRFSALAYSDMIHITSVFEGKKYSYMMYKDGNTVSIDLLNTQDTNERNGLEVKLEIKSGDFNNFAKAIKSQLVYFENLYIIDSTLTDPNDAYNDYINIQEDYNNFSIKKYKNFWVNTLDNSKEINLVLGKVRYPLRIDSLDTKYSQKVKEYPISLVFDIGDLEVTPNREEVLYSDKNREAIEKRLNAAFEEIRELIDKQGTTDVKKVSEYLQEIEETKHLILLDGDDAKVRMKMTGSERTITLQGKSYATKNFKSMYDLIMNYPGIVSQYYLTHNSQIKYNYTSLSLNKIKRDFQLVHFGDLANVKNISKRYIRETFDTGSLFIKEEKSLMAYAKSYMEHIKDTIDRDRGQMYPRHKDLKTFDLAAFKVIFENVVKNMSKIQRFDDSSVTSKWIVDTKAADKAKRGAIKKAGFDWKQNINVHKLRQRDYGGIMTESTPYVMKDLSKSFKKLTIYAEKKNEKIRTLFQYLKYEVRPNMVEVAPTKLKLLDNVDNFVTIEDFMSTNYTLLRNIGTAEYLHREFPELKELARITNLSSISERLSGTVVELAKFVNKYESAASRSSDDEKTLIKEIYEICEEKNYFNESIKGLYAKHKTELQNARILLEFSNNEIYSSNRHIPKKRVNLLVDYLLARKLLRPNIKAVLKVKEETIFNIIPEVDENNTN